jgi:hypothetical protein
MKDMKRIRKRKSAIRKSDGIEDKEMRGKVDDVKYRAEEGKKRRKRFEGKLWQGGG